MNTVFDVYAVTLRIKDKINGRSSIDTIHFTHLSFDACFLPRDATYERGIAMASRISVRLSDCPSVCDVEVS